MKKILWGFGKVQEETIGVFTLIVVEPRHRACVQELLEKSAGVFPLVPVRQEANVPGVTAQT